MTPGSSRKVCHLFLVLSSCLFLHADTKKAETAKATAETSAPPKSYLVEICEVTRSANTVGVTRARAQTNHVNPADKSLSCSGPVRGPFKIEQVEVESGVSGKPVAAADDTCEGMLPKPKEPANPPAKAPGIDFSRIIPLLGSPYPYSLKAQGMQLLVYSAEPKGNIPLLRELLARAADVISRIQFESSAKSFVVELVIPHYSALGNDLAGKLKTLHVEDLNIENVGEGMVRVKGPRDCETWDSFLRQVRRLAWQAYPESPVGKLYYLNAADVKTAFADIGGASPAAPKEKDKAATAGDGTQKDQSAASSADTAKEKVDTTSAKATDDPSSASAASATKSADTAKAADAAKASSDEAKQSAGLGTISNDLLIFQEPTPGNDAAVMEKKRILAALDLPRPEMIINAWVMQNSTTDSNTFGDVNRYIRRLVQQFNQGLDNAISYGWQYLKNQMKDPKEYFDEPFYNYLSRRVIAYPGYASLHAAESGIQEFLEFQDTDCHGLVLSSPTPRTCQRASLRHVGACAFDGYCLGYTTLFEPQEPGLSDLILAIIAAKNPEKQVEESVNLIEQVKDPDRQPAGSKLGNWPQTKAQIKDEHEDLKKIAKELELPDYSIMARSIMAGKPLPPPSQLDDLLGCEQRDQLGTLRAMVSPDGEPLYKPKLFLECFRVAAKLLKAPGDSEIPPSRLGLTRAAIADFLFNYKVSIQYPHEFLPYELTYSADAFNSALAPLVVAFNRDIAAYQGLLRAQIKVEIDDLNHKDRFKHVFSLDKPTFLNDGIVTVNTISGNEATVNTTTQSYIDVSSAPSLSALAAAITGETADKGNVGRTHLNKPQPGVLSNLSFNEVQVLMGALSAYQSSKAKVGRQLNVDVTPRSLVGASAAEVKVTLKADDSASPPIYSSGPGKGSDPEISRFATNEVTTRVRVDSIKLFEISSFTAVLRNARSRFPLLPPFVELPYIGTLAGIPLPSAKQYHSSTAVLSAIVVPTATDFAYGLPFVQDYFVEEGKEKCHWPKLPGASEEGPPCKLRLAVSMQDLGAQPVRGFHNMMVQCLAMDMKSAVPNGLGYTNDSQVCEKLTYRDVLRDWSPFDRP
jgi:hypothetical protein